MTFALPDPMLATSWPAAFDDVGWWFEVKWDGYRIIVSTADGGLRTRSRGGLELLDRFPTIGELSLPRGVVLDGEVVAFDDLGRPSFGLLQQRTGPGVTDRGVSLVVFDVLFAGEWVMDAPYEERRRLLADLDLDERIVSSDPVPTEGIALMEAVRDQGLEGIVAKRRGSPYRPSRRSPDWRKIAVRRSLRAVVGGYTTGTGSRSSTFGSLLVGLWEGTGLRWIGAVGSGFDQAALEAFSAALKELEVERSPFDAPVEVPGGARWVTPGLVVGVEYKEWTRDGRLRAPVFKGIDVTPPDDVTWEAEGPG